jgi:hypothetical protein
VKLGRERNDPAIFFKNCFFSKKFFRLAKDSFLSSLFDEKVGRNIVTTQKYFASWSVNESKQNSLSKTINHKILIKVFRLRNVLIFEIYWPVGPSLKILNLIPLIRVSLISLSTLNNFPALKIRFRFPFAFAFVCSFSIQKSKFWCYHHQSTGPKQRLSNYEAIQFHNFSLRESFCPFWCYLELDIF